MSSGNDAQAVFDRESTLRRLQGDIELLHEVIELFLVTSPRRLDELRASVRSGDAALIARGAHAMKSAVGNFSAKAAGEAALRLEMIGREEKLSEASDALAELEQEVARLQAVLQETLHTANHLG